MDWTEAWDKVTDTLNRGMEGLNRGLLVVFGNSNEREVQKLRPIIEKVNALEQKMEALTNTELKEQTQKFRERLAAGETLDDLLPEAFAACRESGRRFLNMRHFDVQLLGGAVLHSGRIAEMVTGEGKTLVATLPAYLNALEGKGVHVVTVNDYLARRDAEWMSPLYQGLGLTVGAIQSNMDSHERQYHYSCDITYGTNNEFGFDYLRDNMKPTRELQAQKSLNYAIIDEVDSILIDEARTPLIISGPAFDDPTKYAKANRVALQLQQDVHFEVKEKEHTCHLTDAGVLEAERLVGVESFYTAGNMEWPHLIDNALKAQNLYKRDKDYIVDNGQVIIIDEHTGRKMEGRQWSDGLHQAVEAKEGVKIKEETQTLATITFQNFFKLYSKISGMTGTAMTEANEFYKIYKLDVVAIPTNKPLQRVNYPDVIYCTAKEKWNAVVEEVKTTLKTGRPILIGTASVEKSEFLSELFKRHNIKHEVLNAKFVEREAEIVAQAGRRGAVTISTNMAGRGTDIILGGNPEAMAWANLKNKYESRLDVPPEEWRAAVEPYEEEMKQEGLQIKREPSVRELAKIAKVKDIDRITEVIEKASPRELADPESLAKKHNLNVAEVAEVARLKRAAHPGGLHIIGTERHESRRIDNQLRGRAGRQGDPGSSRFYLSLEDDLMRIFAGDWVRGMLQRLGMQDGEAIESRMVSKRIEGAQKKVEERNFETRKNLLEYDEIMDTQRKRVYGYRQDILDGANCKDLALEMIDHQIDKGVDQILQRNYGPISFAAWVGNRLGIEFESRDFVRMDFEQAESTARDEARRQAESMIIDAVDENLSPDVDPREWNWEGLASFVNSRWGLQLNPHHLRRIGRDELGMHLYEHVSKSIDKVHLEGGRFFFDEDFGIKSLIGWVNHKFDLGLKIEDLPTTSVDEADTIAKWLKEKTRETYERKEIEFPVICGLNQFLPAKTRDSGSRYDRDGLVQWAKQRFNVDLSSDESRNLSRHEIESRLLEASKRFFNDGAIFNEIHQRLEKSFPNGAAEVPNDQLQDLARWAEENLNVTLDLSRPLVERSQIERQLYASAERRYRPELREVERALLLQFLDTGWKDHLYAMDHLRSGIGLVSYAQIDPKVEYKRKGKQLFEEMWDAFENKVTDLIFRVEQADSGFVSSIWQITNTVHEQASRPTEMASSRSSSDGGSIREQQDAAIEMSKGEDSKPEPIRNRGKQVGRNSPCPCGSGKKYKNCCMRKDNRLNTPVGR